MANRIGGRGRHRRETADGPPTVAQIGKVRRTRPPAGARGDSPAPPPFVGAARRARRAPPPFIGGARRARRAPPLPAPSGDSDAPSKCVSSLVIRRGRGDAGGAVRAPTAQATIPSLPRLSSDHTRSIRCDIHGTIPRGPSGRAPRPHLFRSHVPQGQCLHSRPRELPAGDRAARPRAASTAHVRRGLRGTIRRVRSGRPAATRSPRLRASSRHVSQGCSSPKKISAARAARRATGPHAGGRTSRPTRHSLRHSRRDASCVIIEVVTTRPLRPQR